MKSLEETKKYIKDHPMKSDKQISRHLNLSKKEIVEIRELLNENKKTPVTRSIERRVFLEGLKSKLAKVSRLRNAYPHLIMFFLALGTRLIYVKQLNQNPLLKVPILDAQYYLEWGAKLVKEGFLGDKVFFTEPFYAYFLAIILKISNNAQEIAIFIQTILGILLPFVIYKIGKKVFNKNVGLIAGIITAVYGPFVFYENLLLKTSIEIFFLALFVLFLVKVFSAERIWQYFLSGIFLGLLVIIKGNNLLLLPLLIFFILFLSPSRFEKRISLAILLFLGFAIAISPIAIRNFMVGKDFVLTNYSFGMNIYQGNRWDTDGSLLQPEFIRPHPKYEETDSFNMAEAFNERTMKPSETSSFWIRKTIAEIQEDPTRWVLLLGKKILLLITKIELSDNYDYAMYRKFLPALRFLPDFWLISALGLTGMLFFVFSEDMRYSFIETKKESTEERKKSSLITMWLVFGIVIAYAFSIMVFHVNARYRMPIIPYFIIFASVAVWYLFEKLRFQEHVTAVIIVGVSILFLFLTVIHLDNFDFMTDANFYNNIGFIYFDQKDYQKSKEYFLKAKEENSNYYWAYNNLFSIYLREGDLESAKEDLKKLITMRPDNMDAYHKLKLFKELEGKSTEEINARLDQESNQAESDSTSKNSYDPYFYEASRFIKQKRYQKAKENLEKSANKFNNPENTILNLSYILKNTNNPELAKKMLQELVDKNPYLLVAKYNLANSYLKEKKPLEAAKLLQDIYDFVPEFGEVWFYLGSAYKDSDNLEAARPIMEAFIKKYENFPQRKNQAEAFKSYLSSNPIQNENTPY